LSRSCSLLLFKEYENRLRILCWNIPSFFLLNFFFIPLLQDGPFSPEDTWMHPWGTCIIVSSLSLFR
jgi:hypothetical protein